MRSNILIRMILILAIYFGLRYFGGEWGYKILYPVILLVTYLHEFGHAFGALITGGHVEDIMINSDGSGLTRTIGGNAPIILMGGYLGSAIFGNLLFLIGARFKRMVNPMLLILAVSMMFSSVFWFSSMFSSGFLIAFSLFLLFIALRTNFGREVLMFLGLACILYIIQDFNVGPSSDLAKYAEIMKVLPADVWMYIWLVVALILFVWNLRIVFKQSKREPAIYESEDFLDLDATT